MDDEQAAYQCIPCGLMLCMEHKAVHETKAGSHSFRQLWIDLPRHFC